MNNVHAAINIESMPKLITNGVVPGKEVRTTLPDLSASTHDQVRIVDISEYREAADALALCFKEDHVAKYFLLNDVSEQWTEATYALHVQIMRYITYAHCSKGLVTTVGSNYDSVALWMPPGGNMDDWFTIFKSGMWRLRYQLQPEGRKRFFNEFLPLLHTTKHDVMKEHDDNSWYLVYIGTKPEARGRGYARALIEMVTNQADAEGLPCYIESSNILNNPLYSRLGFQLRTHIHLSPNDQKIKMDIMVRDPVMGRKEGVYEPHVEVVNANGGPTVNGIAKRSGAFA